MACRVCGFVNATGAETCVACGTALQEVARPVARPGDARCSRHPDATALAPCARCGTFSCGVCLELGAGGKLYCVDCRSRSQPLPWDQREQLGLLRAWFKTCTQLMAAPQATLAMAQREGSLGSSLLFVLVSSLAGFATTLLL